MGDKNEMSNELSNNELSDTEIQKALKEGNMVRIKSAIILAQPFIMKEKIIGASIGSII